MPAASNSDAAADDDAATAAPPVFAAYHIFAVSSSYSSRPPTRTQVLEQRRWDAAAQVRRAQAERASRRGARAEPRRLPQGHTVWEAMRGSALLEHDERMRWQGRLQAQVEEDAALARAIHFSQLDGLWLSDQAMGTAAGALPRPLTPLERHTAMADSGSRATSASELGHPSVTASGMHYVATLDLLAEAEAAAGPGDRAAEAIVPLLGAADGYRHLGVHLFGWRRAGRAFSSIGPPSPLPPPSPPWSLTHAAWNAIMHALRGNTPSPQPEAPTAPARNSAGGVACWVSNVDWGALPGGQGEGEGTRGLLHALRHRKWCYYL